MANYQAYLEKLFSQLKTIGPQQEQMFDQLLAENDSPIILYGSGNLGGKLALAMKNEFDGKIFFTDKNPNNWGKRLHSTPVLPLPEAAIKYGEKSIFIITVFNRGANCEYNDIERELRDIGIDKCIPFSIPAWKYQHELLPHFFIGTYRNILPYTSEIKKAFSLFSDEKSQRIFIDFAQVSLIAPIKKFSQPDSAPQYFTPEVISSLPNQVIFVDCGAYDGDTLRDALKYIGSEKISEYHALEPDSLNFKKLTDFVATLPSDLKDRIYCYHSAVGNRNGYVRMQEVGTESAYGLPQLNGDVPCKILDEVFHGKSCNFIKMDIEGSEVEALIGSKILIQKHSPILAISIYHKPEDFFRIPLLINDTINYASITLNSHMSNLFETILYCLPAEHKVT